MRKQFESNKNLLILLNSRINTSILDSKHSSFDI